MKPTASFSALAGSGRLKTATRTSLPARSLRHVLPLRFFHRSTLGHRPTTVRNPPPPPRSPLLFSSYSRLRLTARFNRSSNLLLETSNLLPSNPFFPTNSCVIPARNRMLFDFDRIRLRMIVVGMSFYSYPNVDPQYDSRCSYPVTRVNVTNRMVSFQRGKIGFKGAVSG